MDDSEQLPFLVYKQTIVYFIYQTKKLKLDISSPINCLWTDKAIINYHISQWGEILWTESGEIKKTETLSSIIFDYETRNQLQKNPNMQKTTTMWKLNNK